MSIKVENKYLKLYKIWFWVCVLIIPLSIILDMIGIHVLSLGSIGIGGAGSAFIILYVWPKLEPNEV